MLVESTSAGQSSTNNISDVLVDIDHFCKSGDETQPIHGQRENWMKMAREEKQSISDRFSAELRLLSSGELLKDGRIQSCTFIFQVQLRTWELLLLLRITIVIKVHEFSNNWNHKSYYSSGAGARNLKVCNLVILSNSLKDNKLSGLSAQVTTPADRSLAMNLTKTSV